MKKVLLSIIMLFLLFSCGNKKGDVKTTKSASDLNEFIVEEVKDSVVVEEVQEELPPLATAESFEDFIYTFASDDKFQLARIIFPLPYYDEDISRRIEKKDWKHDDLFVKQNYYTLLFDNEAELDIVDEESGSSIQVEWIFMKARQVKKYYFERIKGRWMLEAMNLRPIEDNRKNDFVEFFRDFTADSLFQARHIKNPLEFVTTDPDDDFSIIETTLDLNQWFAFKPVLPEDKLSNIGYGQENNDSSSNKIVQLRGVGNGFLNTLFFRQKGGTWELYKFEDTSN